MTPVGDEEQNYKFLCDMFPNIEAKAILQALKSKSFEEVYDDFIEFEEDLAN